MKKPTSDGVFQPCTASSDRQKEAQIPGGRGKSSEFHMTGDNKERLRELCEQASAEQDLEKLLALVEEINRLRQENQARLDNLTKIK